MIRDFEQRSWLARLGDCSSEATFTSGTDTESIRGTSSFGRTLSPLDRVGKERVHPFVEGGRDEGGEELLGATDK